MGENRNVGWLVNRKLHLQNELLLHHPRLLQQLLLTIHLSVSHSLYPSLMIPRWFNSSARGKVSPLSWKKHPTLSNLIWSQIRFWMAGCNAGYQTLCLKFAALLSDQKLILWYSISTFMTHQDPTRYTWNEQLCNNILIMTIQMYIVCLFFLMKPWRCQSPKWFTTCLEPLFNNNITLQKVAD